MKLTRFITMLFAAAIFAVLTSPVPVPAADAMDKSTMDKTIFLNPDDLHWDNAPPSLPQGAKMAVLLGDPSKAGIFVIRFQAPGAYTIPPHYHSRAETLTVLSGTLYLGGGETFDPPSSHALEVGGFHYLPAKSPHFAFSKAPVIVEIHGEGPFDIIYMNPADDPLKAR